MKTLVITIRELEEKDIPSCVEMTITSFPWTAYGLTAGQATKFFLERLSKQLVFVAENEGEVVGFVALKKNVLFANYIRRLVVSEKHRSLGIGSKLLTFVEELTLKEDHLPNVFLLTSTQNLRAITFYLRNNYQIIGKIKDFVDTGLDEYILWKSFGTINGLGKYH